MAEIPTFCRICLESKRSNFSLYLHVQQKYLPSVIESISGVLISSFDEPQAFICKECALAIIQADEIIQRCQESNSILVEQRNLLRSDAVQVKRESDRNQDEELTQRSYSKLNRESTGNEDEGSCHHKGEKELEQHHESEVEVKLEAQDDVHDLDSIEESMYIEPEMLVESILECSPTNNNNTIESISSSAPSKPSIVPVPANIYCSTTKGGSKPKKKYVRSREQYLKRKIRNLPVKEPLTLIGGAGVVRKRKPKSFHRAIPNFYFKCELCHQFESNVASYSVTHLNTVHHIERPAIFKCQLCDAKPFIKNQSLQEHITTIHQQQPKPRDYLCTECGKSFIKNCHLQKHLMSVHKRGELPYKCDQEDCRKSFVEQFALKRHIKQTHSGEQPFACETCGESFAVIHGLRTHMKTAHPADSYTCSQCGYKFTNKSRYETHILHTRCKPSSFACRYCERTYDKLVRLEEHIQTSHKTHPQYY